MKFKVLQTVIYMGTVHYEGEIIDIDAKHGESLPEIYEKVKKKVKDDTNTTDTNEFAN